MIDGLEDRIRLRAYELWESEGRPDGRAQEHWFQATVEFGPAATVKPKRAAKPKATPKAAAAKPKAATKAPAKAPAKPRARKPT